MGLNHQPPSHNGPATPARATTSTRKEPHAHRMGLNHHPSSHNGPATPARATTSTREGTYAHGMGMSKKVCGFRTWSAFQGLSPGRHRLRH
jgi:hypothetical protein